MLTNAAHLSIELRCWTIPTAVVFIFFVILHFVYFICYSFMVQPSWIFDPPVLAPVEAMMTVDFWLVITISTVIALLPRFATRCLWNTLFNEDESKKTN
ncbi:hypothetical protein OESDEN_03781 [Oesophagostomum dentatum]|uniref:P-type ATPase C-terminal domain-containing protein n=1 Tax=Oesophagostomum dentatum TaxID=61180 RepID=A0A0B1TKB8_OESDE|nr:hypothetical protein OESDEN_03781 [Oesophagostomum dentatum]